jgi:hypothetical protein
MLCRLEIAVSNPNPNREPGFPEKWFLYTSGQYPDEVYLVRDSNNRPRVLDHRAA